MKNFYGWRKCLSFLTAAALSFTALGGLSLAKDESMTVSAASSDSRIRVDLNKNDGRKASYTKTCYNWIIDSAEPSYTVDGVTFKLSNGGSVGQGIDSVNCKILQLQDVEKTPTLTMDGVKIKDGDNGGTIKLEISGLSAGTHSLTTWHSTADAVEISTMSISVNGKTTATGVKAPVRVKDSNDAGMSYSTFEVAAGETVTVLIKPEGNASVNNAFLNAFEIDGADPFNSISRMTPVDQEKHLEIEKGLSWTAGANAASHNVYIGTSFDGVKNATTSSAEFKGNVTQPRFALDDSYSSIPTYYWRVDEVNKDGSIVTGAVYSFQVARVAFPTAEGYGRYARGGRGGQIVEVTNLNDSGEGSLRWALCDVKGPRIVVFKVGGVIELKSALVIPEDGGDVYVAGQTAPGDGITLINYDFGGMGTSDAVIRDIRTRVGDMNDTATGGMGLGSCNYCIIDHCSISWATDEGFSSRSAANITFQWSIIGESLNNSVHYDASDRSKTERHAFAASISGFTGSFHHNLLINNTGRNWSLAGAMEQDAVTYGGQLDISNNVVYNWRDRTTDGGVRRLNFVGNYYKAGAESNESLHIVSTDGNELNTSDMQMMYVSGNKMVGYDGTVLLNSSDNAWDKGRAISGGKNSTVADVRSDTPFFENYITLQSADDAYKAVIDNKTGAGANIPALDYIDSRYHNEVTNNKYTYTGSKDGLKGIIDSQNDVGGYPNSSNFKGGTAPTDSDHDGMPDEWEILHGLNPNDPSDGPIVSLSADDYTNVEMYLNELAGDPVEYNGNIAKRSAFDQIEAESFDDQSGVRSEECTDVGGGENVGFIENGDYMLFRGVDFEDGAKSFSVRVAGNASGIELYTDSMNGEPAAKLDFAGTDGWQDWQTVSFNIPKISGVHNLYIRFTGGDGYLMNVNWFTFGRESVSLNGRLIRNLTVADEEHIGSWKIAYNTAVDSLVFGDRDVTYISVPDALKGAETIQTACDSKSYEKDAATFEAGQSISVYVALDSRVETVPEWLSGYTKTTMTMQSSNDVTFVLYKKDFAAGDKITLGANGQSAGCVNYAVFAVPSSSLKGDADANGTVTVADVVMLQKWILGSGKLTKWQNVDMNDDGIIDVFDLVLLKRLLLNK